MSLKWPLALALLLVVPVLLAYLRFRPSKKPVKFVAESTSAAQLPSYKRVLRQHKILKTIEFVLLCCLLASGLILASRPQRQIVKINEVNSHEIVLCQDVSGSMADYISDALGVMQKIIAANPTDKYSIVLFNDVAYTVVPLTRDVTTLNERIDIIKNAYSGSNPNFEKYGPELSLGYSNKGGGTDIGSGIIGCVKRFGDLTPQKNRNIIMISDFEHNNGNIERVKLAAELVPKYQIKMYAIVPDSYQSDTAKDILSITNASITTLGDKNQFSSSLESIFKSALNKEKQKEFVRTDSPQIMLLVCMILATAWAITVWLRWRVTK